MQKLNILQKSETHEVIPSARRLIISLRDLGYDFVSAVADLVDNAIEANSTAIHIDIEFDGDNSSVRIADNGRGMTLEQLREAMRYGTEREYAIEDLGKFGLGLKTASLSQCRKFSVVSRADKKRNDVSAYSWDLDHIEKENRWEIIRPSKNAIKIITAHHLDKSTGTVVYWQRLDRILGYQHPYGENAKKSLNKMCRELEQHLAMVFHRFLAGEVPGRELKINLNGNDVHPWDPFARLEPHTKKLSPHTIRVNFEGVEGNITLEPYVLPHQSNFSSMDAFNRASGPANWNQQQGFYIYRTDRLIQSGGWSKIRTLDEHTKLARIAIRFSPNLDAAFKINVAKMRVQLPTQSRDEIASIVATVTRMAQDLYRNSGQKNPSTLPTKNPAVPDSSLKSISKKSNNVPGQNNPENPSLLQNPDSYLVVRETDSDDRLQSFLFNNSENQLTSSLSSLRQAASNSEQLNWSLDNLEKQLMEIAEPGEKEILQRVFYRFRNNIKA